MQLKKIGQLVLTLDSELKSVNAKVHGTGRWTDLVSNIVDGSEEHLFLVSIDSDIFYINAGTFIAGGVALYNGSTAGGGSFCMSNQLINYIEPSTQTMYARVDSAIFPFIMKLNDLKTICNLKVETNQSVSYVSGKSGVSQIKVNVFLFL